jgi:tape measure domain-containing protein
MSTIEASLQLEIAQYQAALKKAQGDVDRFRQKAQKTGDQLGGAMFGGIAKRAAMLAPILGAGFGAKGILDAVVNMERLEKMMTSATGSAEGAKTRMEELREVAKMPGLDFEQAIQGDVRLRAVGLSAELSKAAIMEFGNALALVGGSSSDLDGVFLALSQIAAKGNVFAEEINQIAERVPQVRAVMKEVFGTADTEAIQAMGLSAEEFISRLTAGFGTLSRANRGLQDEFSELADIGMTMANDIGAPLVKTLIPAFTDLLTTLSQNKEVLVAMGQAMGEVAQGAVKVGGGVMDFVGQVGNAAGQASQGGDFWEAFRQNKAASDAARGATPAVPGAPAGGGGSGVTLPPIVKPDAGAADAEKANKRALAEEAKLREQIAEIQRRARLENLTAAEKEVAIQHEIYRLATSFGQAGPETETARLEIEKRILELKREQAAAAKAAAEEAEAEQERTADAERRLETFQQELDIAEARAAGEDDLADSLQRQLDIQQIKARLMEEMKLSEAEALALAERHVDAQAAINAEKSKGSSSGRYDADGRRSDGRKKIQGYSRERQGGAEAAAARAQNRIDDARAKREIPSGLDAFAAQPGLRDRMAGGGMFPGLEGAFGPGGTHEASPMTDTAAMNAAAADRQPGDAARGLEDKLDRLIAISEQGLLGE